MKKACVFMLVLCLVFFSSVITFAADVDKSDVVIDSEKTSASQTNQREEYTVSTEETLAINEQDKSIDISLTLKTAKTKTTAVETGDAAPVLLLIALMALSAVAAIVLIRKKKLGKVMAVFLSVATLLTGFMSSPGTAEALSFGDSYIDIAFTDEILSAFCFDKIVSVSDGTYSLQTESGNTVGIKWTLGESAKNQTQKLVYRLKMKDQVPDTVFGKTIKAAKTTFFIGSGASSVNYPNTTLKLGIGFDVIYNANGGNDSSVPANETRLPGIHPLSSKKPTHEKTSDDKTIIFVGWSSTQDTNIYQMTDTAPALITQVTIVDSDVTVYAVWGYDENDNGTADILEDKYSIVYDANGGTGAPASESRIPGTYTLSGTVPTHAKAGDRAVVFIGWSLTDTNERVFDYGESGDVPVLAASVKIDDKNITVYAVWSYDDGNGPTVLADTVTITFDPGTNGTGGGTVIAYKGAAWSTVAVPAVTANSGWVQNGWSPAFPATVPNMATTYTAKYTKDAAAWVKLTYNVNGGEKNTLPTPNPAEILKNTGDYTLSGTVPQHKDVGGRKVIFLGWTTTADSKIYEPGVTLPTTVTSVNIASSNVNVYALWGYKTALTAKITSFTVAASGAATQKATSSDFSINLTKTATARQITLKGVVTGTNLSDNPGLTSWTASGSNIWGAASGNSTTYVITIPGNATGTMIVTAVPKDDPARTPIIVTINVLTATKYVVDWQRNTVFYETVKSITNPSQSGMGNDGVLGNDFTHGSTSKPTTSRVWRATITSTAKEKSSKWTIVSQTGTGAVWNTNTGETNYLKIPANYSGTITVRVAALADTDWYVEFKIIVAPRPVVATAGRTLSAAQSGDGSTWVEVATMTVDDVAYSLILRGTVLGKTGSYAANHAFGSTHNYVGSNVQGHINAWYSSLPSGTGIVDYAVTHNALSNLGTSSSQFFDGFSVPLGGTPQDSTDVAFAMSSGEAIEFCCSRYYLPSAAIINPIQQSANWSALKGRTTASWLRSPNTFAGTSAGYLNSSGYVTNNNLDGLYQSVRPALWVKSEIFG